MKPPRLFTVAEACALPIDDDGTLDIGLDQPYLVGWLLHHLKNTLAKRQSDFLFMVRTGPCSSELLTGHLVDNDDRVLI